MKNLFIVISILLLCSFAYSQKEKNIARVDQVSGLYIFVDSEPISKYEYLGTKKCHITMWSSQYQTVRDQLIRKVKKEYPKANGIIIHFHDGGTDLADAIYIK